MSTIATGSLCAGSAMIAALEQGARAPFSKRLAAAGETGVRHEIAVRVEPLLPGLRFAAAAPSGLPCRNHASRRAVRENAVALLIVEQIGDHDLIQHLLMHGWVSDRQQRFDAPVEVSRHEIRGGDVEGRARMGQAVAPAERIDARVLEKAANDTLDPDVFRKSRYARPQAANAAHHQIDRDAGLRREIERVDDLGIDERVALGPDRRRLTGLGETDLLLDVLQELLLER